MNKLFLAVILLFTINYTIAQDSSTGNKQTGKITTTSPLITKGYYSIYKNADKLNHQPAPVVVNKQTTNNYSKGFFAIGSKHHQLHKGGKSFIATTPRQRTATKGYYSIQPAEVNRPTENLMADAADTMHFSREEN